MPPRHNLQLLLQLGRVLREHREAAGMTQVELAAAAGLPVSLIVRMENGQPRTTIEPLAAVARALDTTASALFQEVESKLR